MASQSDTDVMLPTRVRTPFITRIVLENYKSIAACDVLLGPLTFLVGPNGSGKSNFLDALHFVTDALTLSLDHALRQRSGIADVLHRSAGPAGHFGIRLEFVLPDGSAGHYAFRIGARAGGGSTIQREECIIRTAKEDEHSSYYRIQAGQMTSNVQTLPAGPIKHHDLYLRHGPHLTGEFQSLYGNLRSMQFYNINPDTFRRLASSTDAEILRRDGNNIAAVLTRLARQDEGTVQRIEEYLTKITPGLNGVRTRFIDGQPILEFPVQGEASAAFLATTVSNGTLRALGVLVALFQSTPGSDEAVSLVAIEEPEAIIHPAAAGVLLDSLREASQTVQVLVTSHSPDLLDNKDIESDSILAVEADRGVSRIAPLDRAGRSMIREHVYTGGELLRINQAQPDPTFLAQSVGRSRLFDE